MIGHDKSVLQRFDFRLSTVFGIALLVFFWTVSFTLASERPTVLLESNPGDNPSAAKPRDLTGLDVEELLHAEITPIKVLGGHVHTRHEWMAGYRYMFMSMHGNLDGSRRISNAEVLAQGYNSVHTSMTMEMHMVELMYAPTDRLTLMGMGEYRINNADHLRRDGTTSSYDTEGIGDTTLMGTYNIFGDPREGKHRLLLNGGFTIPTGSIQEEPEHPGVRGHYMIQLGSGTYDLLPGVTYLGQSARWAWGGQALGTIRPGMNDVGYRLGNRYRLNSWLQYKVTDWFTPSVRLDWQGSGRIHGSDPELDARIIRNPQNDPAKQAGERLDVLLGLNYFLPRGMLKGARLSVEGGIPVYQYLAGPSPKTDWMVTVGCSFTRR